MIAIEVSGDRVFQSPSPTGSTSPDLGACARKPNGCPDGYSHFINCEPICVGPWQICHAFSRR